jgi:DNA-binding NarL/FixJ family response regulator
MFREQPDAFDLVITDQTMPQTSGIDLAKELIAVRGDVPIILSSGHTDLDPEAASRNGIRAVLSKPLTRAETARSLRAVLDDAPQG